MHTESSGPLPPPTSDLIEAPIDLSSVHFTSRRRALVLMARAFARYHRARVPARGVIFGDHGLGKSQLTYEWSRLTCTREENPYAGRMHLVNRPDRFRSEQTVRLTAARRWLEEVAGNWLLVLDNVFPDTLRFLREHLPRSNGRGSILFTTRSTAGKRHDIIQVRTLRMDDGVELPPTHSGEGDIGTPLASIDGIVKAVMAISHAAAYMKQSGNTAEEMLGLYESKYKIDVISRQHSASYYEPKYIATASENRLEGQHPDASKHVKVLAYFDPESIPLDMLISRAAAVMYPVVEPAKGKVELTKRICHRAVVRSLFGLRDAITEPQIRCLTAYQDEPPHTRPYSGCRLGKERD